MFKTDDPRNELVKVERCLKRGRHYFTSDLTDAHEETKKLKLEVKPLWPHPQLSSPKNTSLLLILPREIRDLIYRHFFLLELLQVWCKDTVIVVIRSRPLFGRGTSRVTTLGLLAVSLQIHEEASKVLYHDNIFHFRYSLTAPGFFETIGAKNCSMMSHLQLDVSHHGRPEPEYQQQWAGILSSTTFSSIHTLELYNYSVLFHSYYFDIIPVPPDILECLVDAVLRLFGRRQDQTIIPSLTLVGFTDGEKAKFPSSWNIVVKHSIPRPFKNKITPAPA